MVAFFASTDAVQTPETTDARARVVADGKPRAILSRRFRRTAETRRRRRHRDDDGGLKTKIISIHSHRHRFRSSTRRWRRRARTRVARSAASSPERSQVRFAVVVVGSSSGRRRERTMKPFLRTEPACIGTVWDAPASALSKVSTSCSSSDMVSVSRFKVARAAESKLASSRPRSRRAARGYPF